MSKCSDHFSHENIIFSSFYFQVNTDSRSEADFSRTLHPCSELSHKNTSRLLETKWLLCRKLASPLKAKISSMDGL